MEAERGVSSSYRAGLSFVEPKPGETILICHHCLRVRDRQDLAWTGAAYECVDARECWKYMVQRHKERDGVDDLKQAVIKVFEQFSPQHIDHVSGTTVGTDLAKLVGWELR